MAARFVVATQHRSETGQVTAKKSTSAARQGRNRCGHFDTCLEKECAGGDLNVMRCSVAESEHPPRQSMQTRRIWPLNVSTVRSH